MTNQTVAAQQGIDSGLFKSTQWKIDPAHSAVHFGVRHMVGRVTGSFNITEGTLHQGGEDLSGSTLNIVIDTNSVNTNSPDRDAHLRSADFFDVANHPTMTFTGAEFIPKDEEEFEVHGLLSLHGITKPVVLHATDGGRTKDPWGGLRAGFHATAVVNRSDFDMKFNMALETGGVLVGEKVTITLDTEFVWQGPGTAN